MNRLITLLALGLSAVTPLQSQDAARLQPMRISVDFARFRGDSSKIFVELYFAIPQEGLTPIRDSLGIRTGADLTLVVTGPDGSLTADRWMVTHRRVDPQETIEGMNLVGFYPLMLGAGEYRVQLNARDAGNPVRTDSVLFRLPIRALDTTKMVLSDIELARTIRQGKPGSQFYKNTLEVVPNVEAMTGEDNNPWIYAEAYGLTATPDRSDYTVRLTVLDALGKELLAREKIRKRAAESSVLVDNVDVQTFRSGTYTLVLALLDTSRRVVASSGKKFFVFNPKLGIDSSLLVGNAQVTLSAFARMDEAELDREFSWLRYLSSEPEKRQYEVLKGADTKRKFMYDFWSRRTQDSRDAVLERVAYANASFKTLSKEGFLTDRGRVHITYGPPDDIDRHPSRPDMRPLEIWTYDSIQSGVIFVFVQRQLGGDYELVHSTHRNELHDENWERFAIEQ